LKTTIPAVGTELMLTGQNSHFRVGSRFRITEMTPKDFTTRLLNRGQVAGPPLIWPVASLKSFSIQDPEERIVIVIEGPMGCGKTTLATLIASGCTNPMTVSPTSDWQIVDLHYPANAVTACGIRELAKQTRIIVCCDDMQAKKFHHWWTAILADAQVFYWRLERQQLVLTKPKSITFKNKYL